MTLNNRVEKLEQTVTPKSKQSEMNKTSGILVIYPGDDKKEKLKEYETKHGMPPAVVIKVIYEEMEPK